MHKVVLWVQTVLVPMLGAPGMFVVAFLDSSFLSFPEINDILLVTSSHIHPERAWLYALMTTLGSVTGCLVMWELGRRGGEAFLAKKFGADRVQRVGRAGDRWGAGVLWCGGGGRPRGQSLPGEEIRRGSRPARGARGATLGRPPSRHTRR